MIVGWFTKLAYKIHRDRTSGGYVPMYWSANSRQWVFYFDEFETLAEAEKFIDRRELNLSIGTTLMW